ncbi:MAG: hypothetical protein ACJ8AT_12835 [Hyalangium sp.]|uniref:hypothetical protein n=1 Tax=Hyalangium sp. TaxID=2028555 RepID=UPI003899CA47
MSIRNLLCATLAVSVLFSAPRAEARFGKHSDSSSSSSSSDSKTHDASAVGDSDKHESSSHHHHSSSSAAAFLVDLLLDIALNTRTTVATHVEVAPAAAPPPPPVEVVPSPPPLPPPPPQVRTSTSEPSPLFVRLGVDGAALDTAAGLSAFLGVEGARAGMDVRGLQLVMPTDDETEEDRLTVMSFHLTYALIAQERARLRLEGGLSSAHAPHVTVLGPSLGLSLEAGIAGNLDIELRAQGTAYPFRQVDAQAGLALHLNSVVLRGGWRTLYLNDNGVVDDVVHEDTFGGPYLGLGFAFF